MHAFTRLDHPIRHGEDAEVVSRKYEELDILLANYEEEVFLGWVNSVDEKSHEGLNRPLMVRDKKTRILKVNFGRETLECLQEAKHLKKDFPQRKIPEAITKLFARFEDFRAYNNSLDKIVDLYNYLKTGTIEKEYRLFENKVAAIDEMLDPALTSLTWNSEDLQGYIERIFQRVKDLNESVRETQDNIIKIHDEVSFTFDQIFTLAGETMGGCATVHERGGWARIAGRGRLEAREEEQPVRGGEEGWIQDLILDQ